ncbi:ECF transporter S component [Brachybacterium hainanense]|uniref:ECF transporter S component n=1 Tax=Brachybacterium hainanense TaxID=1541174 RepID=A0ABV6RB10_9MICO
MTTTAEAARPRFRTIDLVVTAGIGAAFGVAFLGYGAFYSLISPLTAAFKPAEGLLAGIWILPAVIAALVVRRPGAAIGAELIASALEMLLGGQWGWGTIISGIVQGGGVELGFALLAYRRFTLPVAMLAGLLATSLEWVYERFAYYGEMGWGFALLLLAAMAISGVVLGGALGHAAVRALAATGALDPFGAGRERARRV